MPTRMFLLITISMINLEMSTAVKYDSFCTSFTEDQVILVAIDSILPDFFLKDVRIKTCLHLKTPTRICLCAGISPATDWGPSPQISFSYWRICCSCECVCMNTNKNTQS